MTRIRIISTVIFCLYMAAVAFLCFGKPDNIPQLPESWFGLPADKVGHFLMFAPFTVLAFIVFCPKHITLTRQIALLLIIIASGIGLAVGTEQIQALTGYRSAEPKDILADTAGLVFSGICVAAYIILRRRR